MNKLFYVKSLKIIVSIIYSYKASCSDLTCTQVQVSSSDPELSASARLYSISNNISYIDLSNCEKALKEQGIIAQSEYINYIKTDANNSTFTKFDYFAPNGTAIDKKYCNNVSTIVSFPIPEIPGLNLTKYDEFFDKGVNIFEPNDPYFNDRCIPIRRNSTSTTILSRRNDFMKISLICSPGCKLIGINTTTGYMDCDCKLLDEAPIFSAIGNKVLSIISSLNLEIVNCNHNPYIQ